MTLFVVSCSVTRKTPPPVVVKPAVVAPIVIVKEVVKKDSFFENLLGQYPQLFDQVLKNRKDWNVQII